MYSLTKSITELTMGQPEGGLCHVPEAAQPLLIATAEHLLYLVLDVIPSMVGRFS